MIEVKKIELQAHKDTETGMQDFFIEACEDIPAHKVLTILGQAYEELSNNIHFIADAKGLDLAGMEQLVCLPLSELMKMRLKMNAKDNVVKLKPRKND